MVLSVSEMVAYTTAAPVYRNPTSTVKAAVAAIALTLTLIMIWRCILFDDLCHPHVALILIRTEL